ncbi:hypothetical protein OG2516_10024 [Oceanicola granulosus HTCC2516]|uniref:Flagellar protein FliL n=1 Tax=Oceanicola granulosus (strain ATCC BAA-861 / DSM 15982 / KCTC 12143 / HTCC2516) TaxID=314256 RepID=Q2CDH9_OCEGH|nr:flagellar basal body-associated FliL family protein [Oceanicola granulosus]EAR50732.1 hypothetical protein OG2516_10024 [Oceanicola granulosus HTCC2516]
MKALLVPVLLLFLGTGAGVGAGMLLSPPPEEELPEGEVAAAEAPCGDPHEADVAAAPEEEPGDVVVEGRDYARLNNQFVVPVVEEGSVAALVVLSLSLEVAAGSRDVVFAHEPKLRDALLQVLFGHANIGGFDGNFTSAANMRVLRSSLRDAARETMGDHVLDVLIIDIVRQDVDAR